MKLYIVPALYCPFPPVAYPSPDPIEAHTNQWLIDFSLVDNDDMLEHYKKQRFASMIAKSYPYGDMEDLATWCDLNTLLFILDDQLDEQNIMENKETLLAFEQHFVAVLEQHKKCTVEADGAMLSALSDYWRRMVLRSGKGWQKRFIQGVKDMFMGGMWQFQHIISGKKPDLDEYIKIRQYLGAANLATDSLEVTAKIDLPEEIYDHTTVFKLTELCRNAICFANDLFSLSKEMAKSNGADFNLVTILKYKYDLSIEQAITEAAVIHDNCVREFEDAAGQVYIFDQATNTMLNKYVRALGHLMKGNIDWSTQETERYPHIYAQ